MPCPHIHAPAGHFYLTKLLLPTLIATARTSPLKTVRVINASSIVHYMATREGIRWSTIGKGDEAAVERRKLGIARLNGQSRLVGPRFPSQKVRDSDRPKGKYFVLE
jgi:hypothetical protein